MSTHEDYAAGAGFHLSNPTGGEVIVLLHGLGADFRQPLDLLRGMNTEDAAVLAPDARAHGGTTAIGARADFRFDALVSDLRALLSRLGQYGKPVHLVGISMGAAIALRASLTAALPVKSIALIRPAFTDTPLPSHLRVMAKIGDLLRAGDVSAGRDRFMLSDDYRRVAGISALGAASLLSQFDAPHAVERAERLRSVPRNTAYTSLRELGTIDVPTLVIGTEGDPVHPLPLAFDWASAIPRAQFASIPPRDIDSIASAATQRELIQGHLSAQKTASWR